MGKTYLVERLTFRQLLSYAEPKRVARSQTVRGGPLKIEAFEDTAYHIFNFKSFPSTTGLRHHGYIKFFKPKSPRRLEDLECLVDCTCPDFRYRWAWALKQRGSSVVGAQSMNRALNRAPRTTNPEATPGICKHIIRLRDYILGLTSDDMFSSGTEDASQTLRNLARYANNRWTDPAPNALDREARLQAARLQRNRGQLPSNAPPPPPNAPGSQNPSTGPATPLGDSVLRLNMNKYATEIRLCEELEASAQAQPTAPALPGQDEPSEALKLLREIRNFLADISANLDSEEEEAEEEEAETSDIEAPDFDTAEVEAIDRGEVSGEGRE
jgi:hypothetical protein